MMFIPWIICVVLVGLLAAAVFYLIRLGRIILDVEDALTESLEILDKGYKEISDVLDTPVMMDSPEVRQVLFQIKRIRDSVLYISNVLAEPYGGVVEDEEEAPEEEKEYNRR